MVMASTLLTHVWSQFFKWKQEACVWSVYNIILTTTSFIALCFCLLVFSLLTAQSFSSCGPSSGVILPRTQWRCLPTLNPHPTPTPKPCFPTSTFFSFLFFFFVLFLIYLLFCQWLFCVCVCVYVRVCVCVWKGLIVFWSLCSILLHVALLLCVFMIKPLQWSTLFCISRLLSDFCSDCIAYFTFQTKFSDCIAYFTFQTKFLWAFGTLLTCLKKNVWSWK